MGGSWSPNPLPIRPGGYINFESSGSAPVAPGDFGRVGMPVRSTWGPANQFVDIVTDAQRRAVFGDVDGDPASTTETSWLIREAIIGGAELVKAYRIVGAGSAAATVSLDDWVGDAAVTIDAKYDGTRGNDLSITVAASPVLAGKSVLSVVENGVALEEWVHDEDDLEALADAINAGSSFITATLAAGTEASEVTDLVVAAPLTAGDLVIGLDLGDGAGVQSTSDIAWNASTVANVQSAIDAALAAAGYTAGDIVVSLQAGADGLDSAGSTTYRLTAGAGLANQNIAVTVADGTAPLVPALPGSVVVTTVTAGARSPLAYATSTMAGGLNGAAPTLGDYTAVLDAFEAEGGFDLFALDGVSEEDFVGLDAALKVWADTNNEAGRYVMVVTGGGATELSGADVVGAISRSALNDSEWVVNLGVSGLNVTTPRGNEISLTSAQSAARVAGQIAASGITGSVTFSEVAGATVNGPLTPAQVETLITNGVVTFAKRGDVTRIEDGVTTFTSVTEEKDFTFTQIRAVRAIQQIGLDVSEIVERDWVGKLVNTTSVRDSLVARLQEYFNALEAQKVLVNGTTVQIDTRYDNTRTNVFVLVEAQFQFELKRVLLTVRVPTVTS